jgi:hypothetical protein
MSLPKLSQPMFDFEIPSQNTKANFRPFLVKEEKILFTAQQSKSRKEIAKAIRQVINNCCVDEKFDVDSLSVSDAEYLFLQLRGVSVNNVVEIQIIDEEDNKPYKFEVDISDIKIVRPKKKVSNDIKVSNTVGVILEYPTFKMIENFKDEISNEYDLLIFYLRNCIKSIYDENDVYDPKSYSQEELDGFIQDFSPKIFEKIKQFFESAPRMEHTIKYKNSLGNEKKITLSSLEDFFTLL